VRRRCFIAAVAAGTFPCRVAASNSLSRQDVLKRLRPKILELLDKLEKATGLKVHFCRLPGTSAVVATFFFDPHSNIPFISLAAGWKDEDVAHELTHMQMELVEGFSVLAWKRRVIRTDAIEAAFGRVRAYTDDEVVHARLARAGFRVDGEVLKPQLFDGLYTNVANRLEAGCDRPDDGMAHLDRYGYGPLCRAAFLMQAERILQNYSDVLSAQHVAQTKRFIRLFRKCREHEAHKADCILALFTKHDVNTVEGHRSILTAWTEMEHLDLYVGPSTYMRRNGKFFLPWPE